MVCHDNYMLYVAVQSYMYIYIDKSETNQSD